MIRADPDGLRMAAAATLAEAADVEGVSTVPPVGTSPFAFTAAVESIHARTAAAGVAQAQRFTATACATTLAALVLETTDTNNAVDIKGVIL